MANDFEYILREECPCCETLYAQGTTKWRGITVKEDDGTEWTDRVCEECAEKLEKISP